MERVDMSTLLAIIAVGFALCGALYLFLNREK
jgi:hypothetical protein